MELTFFGDAYAELFTKQLNESLAGGLQENYISEGEPDFPRGFLRASRKYNYWWNTCWTRDSGSFIRELALRGYLKEAAVCAGYLIDHVDKNKNGFYSFPTYFGSQNPRGSGDEQDGTANIVMGLIELYIRLDGPEKNKIHSFLVNESSPVRGILSELRTSELVLGSGEFGGGWCVDGSYYNITQNLLILAMLRIFNKYFPREPEVYETAQRLYNAIRKHLIKDSAFVWCLDTHYNEYDVSYSPYSNGTANINGVAGAVYDGLYEDKTVFANEIRNTANKLINSEPLRKYLYDTYGMLTFTKAFPDGHKETYIGNTSWLAYCECYLAEVAVVIQDKDMLTKTIRYIVGQTAFRGHMPKKYTIPELMAQENFYFNERNFSPEWEGKRDEGCGSLNLINIAEPLHLARMMADLNGTIDIAPVLPFGFDGFTATGYSVWEKDRLLYYDITYDKGKLTILNSNRKI